MNVLHQRSTRLFVILGALFVSCVIIAEMIGVKLFQLEDVLGWERLNMSLLGQDGLSLVLSVGVLPWPIIFILTDVINDYYGVKGVRFLTLLTVGITSFAFLVFYLAISLPPDNGWWIGSGSDRGVPDMQAAFANIFGQGMNIIIGSLTAFAIGQLADAYVFRWIKSLTGDRRVWLRATGSTLISQLIDSFVVTYVAFWLFRDMTFAMASALAITAYMYKFVVAVISTPVIYLAHWCIALYLGKEEADQLRHTALQKG